MKRYGDELWESFCSANGVRCEPIGETSEPRPDYIACRAERDFLVEVKTLKPNDEERSINARRKAGEVVVSGAVPGERLRREIRAANRQFKPLLSQRQLATLLVVFNDTGCSLHTKPYSVMTAMQGLDVVGVRVPLDRGMRPGFGATRSGPERAMRPDANTSTSALGILTEVQAGSLRLDVYHNRFAVTPLELAVFRGIGHQFCLPENGTNSVDASWVER